MTRSAGSPPLWVLVTSLVLLLGAATAQANNPFYIPREQFFATVKTVGIMPVEVDAVVQDADEVALRAEAQIAALLEQAGFTVVPASAMREIRVRGQKALGGTYDPTTGAPLPERIEALREFSEHEYQAQHPVDAVVYAEVVRRTAVMDMGEAVWDGVRERITSKVGSIFLKPVPGQTPDRTILALSLALRLSDAQGQTVYAAFGGMLALSLPTPAAAQPRYVPPLLDVLAEANGSSPISRAVSVAVTPLMRHAAAEISFPAPRPAQPQSVPGKKLKELQRDYRHVALTAVQLPDQYPEPRPRTVAHYQALLVKQLKALGFDVTTDDDAAVLWSAERTAAGGFYDPYTGRLETAKITAARAHLLASLQARHHVAALVVPSIVPRAAPFGGGYASWDGALEPVTGTGSWVYNASIFNGNIAFTGTLYANSLRLQIVADGGKVVFESFGGLELRTHLADGQPVPVPAAELFQQPDAEARSVTFALEDLVKQQARDRACTAGC